MIVTLREPHLANIASVLKSEISRQARKEMRGETESLKKASSRYRTDIAALKRQNALLEQRVARLEKFLAKSPVTTKHVVDPGTTKVRFRVDGLKKLRARLELSAPVLASILGVSAQSIYNWEAGSSRPGKELVAKIAVLRKMGKREVNARLQAMQASPG